MTSWFLGFVIRSCLVEISTAQASSHQARGYLICLTATVFWSTTGVLIRYLTETFNLPSLVLAFWRDLFVALALLMMLGLFLPARLPAGRDNVKFFALYGLILAVFNSLWTVSVALNGAAVATVLAYGSAAFTALLGWKFLHESLGPVKVTAVVLSLAGCALVSGAFNLAAWQINPWSILIGLVSGLMFAFYSMMGKASSNRKIYPWTAMLYSFAVAAGFLCLFNLAASALTGTNPQANFFWLGDSALGWGVLVLLAVVPTVGGFGLYTVSLTYLPASVANLIATLEPAMTAVLAYFFLGEQLTPALLAGSGLILAGVVVLRLLEDRV
jgi:drug/metabolite transporter (DMT)-like permease